MIELNSETFYLETKKTSVLLCVFYQDSINKPEEVFARIFGNKYTSLSETIAYIDIDKSQDIAQMLGISTEEPTVLIMREQIVLFCEPISELNKHDVSSILQQVSKLDMEKIKHDVEIERQSQAHIFGRNVCPAAKRTRGK
ncbi:MAG: hypothetical protein GKR92_04380 [Gammaproteobacteria bacterium]|nr:MAG: hypothetical protein GKR92_04380 [Gammaproteobacteria bacterium]